MKEVSYPSLTLENIFRHKVFDPEQWQGFNKNLPGNIRKRIEEWLQAPIAEEDFSFSPDHRYLLFLKNKTSRYRRSAQAEVFLLEVSTLEVVRLEEGPVLHATFSPTGKDIAYVRDNNLFVYNIAAATHQMITRDGRKNHIINGLCDWVYEEEFGFSQAYQWSPDGNAIAYLRFDESQVREYRLTYYDDSYNQPFDYKYPKAGERNSEVSAFIYQLQTATYTGLPVQSEGGYLPKMMWASEHQLMLFHLNRRQNDLQIWEYETNEKRMAVYYRENNPRYIELTPDWYFPDNSRMVYTSEKEGFNNIYLRLSDGSEKRLTPNLYEVDHIVALDKPHGWIYFSAAYPHPRERQLFVLDEAGECRQLTHQEGWHELTLNAEGTLAVIAFSTVSQPPVWTEYAIDKPENENLPVLRPLREILSNSTLQEKRQHLALVEPEWISFPNAAGENINGWMLKPADFDPGKSYPLLFCNYGGPGYQTVTHKYGAVTLWHQYMARLGCILVSFDNTGTGGRGEDFKKRTYLQLGKLEIEDQICMAQQLSRLPYIDATRIGHWGWSFGGFMSALAISKGAGIFSFAVAIAPVTHWQYYDSVYTERYMRTPEENPDGYAHNSPFHYTRQITGKLLLIHGSADDNVHIQHTMQWSKKLIEENIPFEMAIYPDKNHRIQGGNTSYHLWNKVTEWISENFIIK